LEIFIIFIKKIKKNNNNYKESIISALMYGNLIGVNFHQPIKAK
jgi:hypothetical protein